MKHLLIVLFSLSLVVGCAPHKEPTFAKWVDQLEWEVPIRVYNGAKIKWFNSAIQRWNHSDCDLFVEVDDPMEADVIVIRGKPGSLVEGNRKKKGLRKLGSYSKSRQRITLFVHGNDKQDAMILTHELGHALGLRHDYRVIDSIMKPGQSLRSYSWARPSLKDREATRARWCKEINGK